MKRTIVGWLSIQSTFQVAASLVRFGPVHTCKSKVGVTVVLFQSQATTQLLDPKFILEREDNESVANPEMSFGV